MHSVSAILPPFTAHQDAETLTLILSAAGVDPESLVVEYPAQEVRHTCRSAVSLWHGRALRCCLQQMGKGARGSLLIFMPLPVPLQVGPVVTHGLAVLMRTGSGPEYTAEFRFDAALQVDKCSYDVGEENVVFILSKVRLPGEPEGSPNRTLLSSPFSLVSRSQAEPVLWHRFRYGTGDLESLAEHIMATPETVRAAVRALESEEETPAVPVAGHVEAVERAAPRDTGPEDPAPRKPATSATPLASVSPEEPGPCEPAASATPLASAVPLLTPGLGSAPLPGSLMVTSDLVFDLDD